MSLFHRLWTGSAWERGSLSATYVFSSMVPKRHGKHSCPQFGPEAGQEKPTQFLLSHASREAASAQFMLCMLRSSWQQEGLRGAGTLDNSTIQALSCEHFQCPQDLRFPTCACASSLRLSPRSLIRLACAAGLHTTLRLPR